MPRFLGHQAGVSFQIELLVVNILGLIFSTLEWGNFKWNQQTEKIWNLTLNERPSSLDCRHIYWIKTILSWIVILRIFLAPIYSLTYISNIYSVLTWSRPYCLIPWMVLSFFKNLILEIVVFALCVSLWYGENFSVRLLIEFVIVKIVPLSFASYNWYNVLCYFMQLRGLEKIRRIRRIVEEKNLLFAGIGSDTTSSDVSFINLLRHGHRSLSNLEEFFYPSPSDNDIDYKSTRSLTTLLTVYSQDSEDMYDPVSQIIDDVNLSLAEKCMKLIGISEKEVTEIRNRPRDRLSFLSSDSVERLMAEKMPERRQQFSNVESVEKENVTKKSKSRDIDKNMENIKDEDKSNELLTNITDFSETREEENTIEDKNLIFFDRYFATTEEREASLEYPETEEKGAKLNSYSGAESQGQLSSEIETVTSSDIKSGQRAHERKEIKLCAHVKKEKYGDNGERKKAKKETEEMACCDVTDLNIPCECNENIMNTDKYKKYESYGNPPNNTPENNNKLSDNICSNNHEKNNGCGQKEIRFSDKVAKNLNNIMMQRSPQDDSLLTDTIVDNEDHSKCNNKIFVNSLSKYGKANAKLKMEKMKQAGLSVFEDAGKIIEDPYEKVFPNNADVYTVVHQFEKRGHNILKDHKSSNDGNENNSMNTNGRASENISENRRFDVKNSFANKQSIQANQNSEKIKRYVSNKNVWDTSDDFSARQYDKENNGYELKINRLNTNRGVKERKCKVCSLPIKANDPYCLSNASGNCCECGSQGRDSRKSGKIAQGRVHKHSRNSDCINLENWGTLTLAQVARTSGFESSSIRAKPPIYPRKGYFQSSSRSSLRLESDKFKLVQKNKFVEQMQRKRSTDRQAMYNAKSLKTKKYFENVEDRDAREMRALIAYNKFTLEEDKREMEIRKREAIMKEKSLLNEENVPDIEIQQINFLQAKTASDPPVDTLDQLGVSKDNSVDYRLTGDANIRTVLSSFESTQNHSTPPADNSPSDNFYRKSANSKLLNVTTKDAATILELLNTYGAHFLKQELKRICTGEEVEARKRYTKYSSQRKNIEDDLNVSSMSCKRVEGAPKGRDLDKSPAKADIRNQIGNLPEFSRLSSSNMQPRHSQVDTIKFFIRKDQESLSSGSMSSVMPEEVMVRIYEAESTNRSIESEQHIFTSHENAAVEEVIATSKIEEEVPETRDTKEPVLQDAIESQPKEKTLENILNETIDIANQELSAINERHDSASNLNNEAIHEQFEYQEVIQRDIVNVREIARNIDWSFSPQGVVLTNKNLQGRNFVDHLQEVQQRHIVDDNTASMVHSAFYAKPEIITRTFHRSPSSTDSPSNVEGAHAILEDNFHDLRQRPSPEEFVCRLTSDVEVYREESPVVFDIRRGQNIENDLDHTLLENLATTDIQENNCDLCIVIIQHDEVDGLSRTASAAESTVVPSDSSFHGSLEQEDPGLNEILSFFDNNLFEFPVDEDIRIKSAMIQDTLDSCSMILKDRVREDFGNEHDEEVADNEEEEETEKIKAFSDIHPEDFDLHKMKFHEDETDSSDVLKKMFSQIIPFYEEPIFTNFEFPIIINVSNLINSYPRSIEYRRLSRIFPDDDKVTDMRESKKEKQNEFNNVNLELTTFPVDINESPKFLNTSSVTSSIFSGRSLGSIMNNSFPVTENVSSISHDTSSQILLKSKSSWNILTNNINIEKSLMDSDDEKEICQIFETRETRDNETSCDPADTKNNRTAYTKEAQLLSLGIIIAFWKVVFLFYIKYFFNKLVFSAKANTTTSKGTSKTNEVHDVATSTTRLNEDAFLECDFEEEQVSKSFESSEQSEFPPELESLCESEEKLVKVFSPTLDSNFSVFEKNAKPDSSAETSSTRDGMGRATRIMLKLINDILDHVDVVLWSKSNSDESGRNDSGEGRSSFARAMDDELQERMKYMFEPQKSFYFFEDVNKKTFDHISSQFKTGRIMETLKNRMSSLSTIESENLEDSEVFEKLIDLSEQFSNATIEVPVDEHVDEFDTNVIYEKKSESTVFFESILNDLLDRVWGNVENCELKNSGSTVVLLTSVYDYIREEVQRRNSTIEFDDTDSYDSVYSKATEKSEKEVSLGDGSDMEEYSIHTLPESNASFIPDPD